MVRHHFSAIGKRTKDPATPTLQDYVFEASSIGINITTSVLKIFGAVPLAQTALGLALELIKACQYLNEIDDKVSELKDYIKSITEAVIKAIEETEGKDIPQDLLNDIEKLQKDLEVIKQDLDKIAAQPRLLIALFKTANKTKVERCIALLKRSLDQWHVSSALSNRLVLHHVIHKVGGMEKTLSDLLPPAHTAQHAWTRQMPPKPKIFYGRDLFVNDIVNILIGTNASSKPPRVCIHGPGGMGKTSTAIAVMEHPDIRKRFSKENRFWVPCVSATSPDILLHILYSNLRISRDTRDYLSDIVTELESSAAPRLMLLDNFETPWNSIEGTRDAVEDILRSLSALSQLSILVTMRANVPPSEQIDWIDKPLSSVDVEASKEIFCAIYPDAKGKPEVEELLAELGHMPFAITLVATLGKTSTAMPEKLLKDWREYGPEILSSDELVEDSMSRSIGLSMNSMIVLNNAPTRALLATLAMLPAGTTPSHLDWWAPELGKNKNAAISTLNNVALIVHTKVMDGSETLISLLPVVQSYMRRRNRIPLTVRKSVCDACFKFVLNHNSSPGDVEFKSDLQTLVSEESNIQHILLEATRDADNVASIPFIENALDVLLAFSWYQHWTRPRTEVVEHTLKLARKVQLDQYVAECLFCLGGIYLRLDRYESACECYIEAQKVFRNLSNISRASECCFELAEVYQCLRKPLDMKQVLECVSKEDIAMNSYVGARAGLALGRAYWYIREFNKALEPLNTAKEAFEKLSRPVDMALCLRQRARVFGSLHKWPEALGSLSQSLELFETFGLDHELSEALNVKSSFLLKTKAPIEEVLPTLERALQKQQELGSPCGIAQMLELFGEFYAKQQNIPFAVEYYKAAEMQYLTIAHVIMTKDVDRCQHNANVLKDAAVANVGLNEALSFLSDFLT